MSNQFSNTPETMSRNTNDKKATYKMNDYDYILLTFYFISKYSVISNRCCLLLLYEILIKAKRHINIS